MEIRRRHLLRDLRAMRDWIELLMADGRRYRIASHLYKIKNDLTDAITTLQRQEVMGNDGGDDDG